jgi:F1F0 ATPase subunit 2
MSEPLMLLLACLGGGILGTAFFGGLRWTVRRGLFSPRPALWFLTSLLLRMTIVLAGFYVVSSGKWQRLLLCLLGFVMARILVTRFTRNALEGSHAPQF